MNKSLYSPAIALLLVSTAVGAQQNWQIHEWGTFTSLQDESGQAIGGINTDDEPVPGFVHGLGFALLSPTEEPPIFFQVAPSCHPDVTMRLETPVIYFHPPPAETGIQSANVRVQFRGGWLTEFYPDAVPSAPGLTNGFFRFPHLRPDTTGGLAWGNLQISATDDWLLTNTSAHVWTSPRNVQAALVQATNGESEKFLFYRGVAHIDAPLKISRDARTGELLIRSQLENLPVNPPVKLPFLWLVDIQPGGEVAFRRLPSLVLDGDPDKILEQTPATFEPESYGPGNLKKLKASLKAALVSEGLFDDEAQALLNTWELSYFKSPGERVFFLVPRAWTDYYLPLQISLPAEIHRVMVGRIELVTPEQRDKLHQLAQFSPAAIHDQAAQLYTNFYGNFLSQAYRPATRTPQELDRLLLDVERGQEPLSALAPVPQSYQTYLDLGRFRNALLLDEEKKRPSEALSKFIAQYRLQAYQPVGEPPGN